jgi:hypothetical protein
MELTATVIWREWTRSSSTLKLRDFSHSVAANRTRPQSGITFGVVRRAAT